MKENGIVGRERERERERERSTAMDWQILRVGFPGVAVRLAFRRFRSERDEGTRINDVARVFVHGKKRV